MAFWGVEIKSGKPFTLSRDNTCGRLRISQLEFQEAEDVTLSVVGPRSVHITGYILGKTRQLLAGDDESESYGEDVGDTDTEVSNELSDEDEYDDSFINDGPPSCSPSSSEEVKKGKKKAKKTKGISKRLKKGHELIELEDADVGNSNNRTCKRVQIIDSDEDDQKPISSLFGDVKRNLEASKRKLDDVVALAISDIQSDNEKVREKKMDNVAGQGTDNSHDYKKVTPNNLDNTGNPTDDNSQSVGKKLKRKKMDDVTVQTTDDCPSDDRKAKKKKTKSDDVIVQANDDCQSEQKIKKKKRKNKSNESPVKGENGGTDVHTRTLAGGLVIEDLEIGQEDGKVATSGKKVTVNYTGVLKEEGRIFVSTIGKSPLKIRLGKDTALDGLRLGIDDMEVKAVMKYHQTHG